MTFLTPFLLVLTAFAAIPVLLHLIKRKRVRILDFPTFRFLKQAAMEQRFHLRLQDQLLMLLRILILLLLALAFAGPLTQQTPPVDSPYFGQENILLIDNSLSMNVLDEDQSIYEWTIEWAEWILDANLASWKVILATDLLQDDPLAQAVTDSSSLRERIETEGAPTYRGPLSQLVEGFRKNLDQETPLWVLSDRTSVNWEKWLKGPDLDSLQPLDILTVGPGVETPNSALHPIQIRNEPLLLDEPANAIWVAETFGAGDPRPLMVQSTTQFMDDTSTRQDWDLTTVSSQSRFEFLFPGKPAIKSISATLIFPPSTNDPLPHDDSAYLEPHVIEESNGLLLAGPSKERDLLLAAMQGLPFTTVDPQSPMSIPLQTNPIVVILSDQPIAPEWFQLIQARVQSGAGLLVFYDRKADGTRQQNWTDWWQAWSAKGESLSPPGGDYRLLAGVSSWFANRLDPSAMDAGWTRQPFSLFRLVDWPGEWIATSSSGEEFPLFQAKSSGQGVVATWNVPLSVEENSLTLSPGWIPLLFQMVKRTLITPDDLSRKTSTSESILESDLRSLSEDEVAHLAEKSHRIHAIEEFSSEFEKLPKSQFDWTLILLSLCLFLSLVEIGLSNYL